MLLFTEYDKLEQQSEDLQHFHSHFFKTGIENMLVYYRRKATHVELDGATVYKYRNDFYGLLLYLNYDISLHWYLGRINNIKHPHQDIQNMRYLLVPDTSLGNILSYYRRAIAIDERNKYLKEKSKA